VILSANIKSGWLAFRKWGEASFTIMLIPHTERKILSFQISNFVLLFALGVLGLTAASWFVYRQTRESLSTQLTEIRRLDTEYREAEGEAARSIALQNEHLRLLGGELEALNIVFGGGGPVFAGRFEERKRSMGELKMRYGIPRRDQSANLVDLRLMENRLVTANAALARVQRVYEARERVLRSIPFGFPLAASAWSKTSSFGVRFSPFEGDRRFHTGVDLAAYPGVPIVAAADGTVVFSGTESGYGNIVRILHRYGWVSVYAHNARNLAWAGQSVKRGDKIALLGSSGRATGPHIHFEIRVDGQAVDPWPYLVGEF
jgi:murein DD-endopeptidase MepM/ murein hydrolase activator NlpD